MPVPATPRPAGSRGQTPTSKLDPRVVEHEDYKDHAESAMFFDGARVLVGQHAEKRTDGAADRTEVDEDRIVWQGDLIATTDPVWDPEQQCPVVYVSWRTNYSYCEAVNARSRQRLTTALQDRQATHPELDIAGLLAAFDAGEEIAVGPQSFRERLVEAQAIPLRALRIDPTKRRGAQRAQPWTDAMLDKMEAGEDAVEHDHEHGDH